MSRYVALVRLQEWTEGRVDQGIEDRLPQLVTGVERASLDAAGSSMCVWFDRGVASLVEIVRAIETFGAMVAGVAQSRDPRPGEDPPHLDDGRPHAA